uniref:Uncharacterized protein n=1 Tax=Candidatus Kentrum sp. MB TaxID=2138164 RepID=A0A450XY79_9GAMM|nr:MAG: hypothetical protein BECKMB1821G_GA0114241_106921 [Candidatus Kentron sp. MB]VFK34259.1 MAG: hypothetical protein BECKMB1821I_GA0114274_106620 [Candidatus Kentron sp. MB]VFK76619.1 MAG: hypothetical protein BECKMB1821H_GA0114242_106522 [Candidatus Kentron sp. MB]
MSDWLNARKSAAQIEETNKEKKERLAYYENQFKAFTRKQIKPKVSSLISDLLFDIGLHRWGKGFIFPKFRLTNGFACNSLMSRSNRGLGCEYFWLVKSKGCHEYGYKVSLRTNITSIKDFYGDELTSKNFYLLGNSNDNKLMYEDVSNDTLKEFLNVLYSKGTNYEHDDCNYGD